MFADAHRIAAFEPAVRREDARTRNTEARALLRELVDPERVLELRTLDGDAGALRELRRAAAVVDVPVRDEDFRERRAALVERGEQPVDVAARIHERRLAASRRRRRASSSAGTA